MLLPVTMVWAILLGSTFGLECDETKQAKLVYAVNAIFCKAKEHKLGFGRPEGIRIDNEKSSVAPAKLETGSISIGCPSKANVFMIAAKTKDANLLSFDIQGMFVKEDLLQPVHQRRKRYFPTSIYTKSSGSSSRYSGSSISWSTYSAPSKSYPASSAYLRQQRQEKEKKKQLEADQKKLKAEQEKRQTGGEPLAFKTCIRSIEIDFAGDLPSVIEVGQSDDESCTKIAKPGNPETWGLKTILKTDNFIWNREGLGSALAESDLGMTLSPHDRPAAHEVAKCYWQALKDKGFEAADNFPASTGSLALLCFKQDWSMFKFFPETGKPKNVEVDDEFTKCNQRNQEKTGVSLEKANQIWKLIGVSLCDAQMTLRSLAGLSQQDAGEIGDCTIKALTTAGFKFSITSPTKPRRYFGQQFHCKTNVAKVTEYDVQDKVDVKTETNEASDIEKLNDFRTVANTIDDCLGKVLHYPTEKQQEMMSKEIQALFDRGCNVKTILEGVVAKLWGKA